MSITRRIAKHLTTSDLFDAEDTNTSTEAINVSNYQHIVISLTSGAGYDGTIKAQGAVGPNTPDFTAAASVANPFINVALIDYEDAAGIEGDTGIAIGASGSRLVMINVDGLDWVGLTQSGRTAGALTAHGTAYSNQ